MTDVALSRNGVPIRLTDERWAHISDEHPEVATLRDDLLVTLRDAERVLQGNGGELLAVRMIQVAKAMIVVYRETSPTDGFVITAFVTRRLRSLDRRVQIWPQLP